jgi:threonine synthase
MPAFHFRCSECGTTYPDGPILVCPNCSAKQEPGGVTRGVLEIVLEDVPSEWPDSPTGLEFALPFLPASSWGELASFRAGGTPLLAPERLRDHLGNSNLWLKDDTRNPSGSTKDRASVLVVARAIEYGFDTIATASTGNAATALAAAAAAAGKTAVVFVPESMPDGKLVQMLSYGATVLPVRGSYDDAFELCLSACREFGWYNRNTALNPFTIEGKKTAALEIAREIGQDGPDVVLVPTGDGVILSGLAKGFTDLRRGGLLREVPRLIAVQPERSSAIVRALRSGAAEVIPMPDAGSIADSLTVQVPRNGLKCLQDVRDSGGAGLTVTEQEIVESIPQFARLTGVFAEPSASAVLPGLRRALDEGLVGRDERIVLMVTGNGLKDVGAAGKAVRRPVTIEPNLESVHKQLFAT